LVIIKTACCVTGWRLRSVGGGARYLPARRLTIPVSFRTGLRREPPPLFRDINASEPVLVRRDWKKTNANHANRSSVFVIKNRKVWENIFKQYNK
jgi:hypothetical protein